MEDVDDLLEGFLGLVLASHIPEGDAGLLLHIDLGVGLAHAAQAAHAALSTDAPEQEHHQSHHQQQGKHIGEDQAEEIGRLVHRLGVGVIGVLLQHGQQLRVVHPGQGDGDILLFLLRLGGNRDQGVHQASAPAGGLLPGQLHLHAVPQGEGVFAVLQIDGVDLVLRQPLLEGGVGHFHSTHVGIAGGAALDHHCEQQGPKDDADQAHDVSLVVISVIVSFIWFQRRKPPAFSIRSFGLLRPGVRGTLISIIPYLLIKNKKERCKHFVKVDDAAPSPVFFPGFLSFRPFSSDPRNLTLPLPAGL